MQSILRYFPDLSEKQKEQFAQLDEVYRFWNERINVISRKDIDNLYIHHILHSLAIAKIISFEPNAHILDVGTGGGFPGVPLAIFFPEVNFHLADSIGKKIKVVQEVAKTVGLKNIFAEQTRVETIKNKYDFIVSRAVTTLPEFHRWIQGKIAKISRHKVSNGLFYLKGGDLTQEIAPFVKTSTLFTISDYFEEEFFKEKKIVYLPLK